ncbi:hypothetical protein NUU61_006335 [Penicillium alfredii]|uniref:C2H2-type domain-containing protein n=1 Tax=Penicillium alfredii TaxID=1506179 RepID=A0A9W9F0Z0_9EURO|nr:uncharacterized protein NUU61_006335 [Penicillium alfredii]KAJ5091465.1 hypothetical protein NUU61_006335 [Penicillium alfredii]
MLMYPRKGLITDPFNPEDVVIQDDQFPPDFYESSLQCQPTRLQSPFQSLPDVQVVSPPSSAPSSPSFSSPTFSISYPPTDSQSFGAPSMTPAPSNNPSSDSPSQQYLPQYPQYYTSMLAQQPIAGNQAWDGNLQLLSPARIPYAGVQKKASPNSSAHATSPTNLHRRSASSSKPLPTPVQTPIQNSFLAAPFQHYDPSIQDGSNVEAESAMRRAIMDQQKHSPQQQQSSDYSLAPSVSSMSHNSPVTPQTSLDELDDASKTMTNGETRFPEFDRWMDEYLRLDALPEYANNGTMSMGIPKLNRTISDIYQDELYNPTVMAAPQMSKPLHQNLLTPRNVIADRLQAANQGHMSARSRSPLKRERSPFRTSSPFAADLSQAALQQPQMTTSIPMAQNGMNMGQPVTQGDLKTMSPKDAVLDFHDNDETTMPPLFPTTQADFNLGDALSAPAMRPSQTLTTMDAFPSQYATPTPTTAQSQFPFAQQQSRHSQNNLLQQTPEFPASLPRLESTGSDVHPTTELTSPQTQAKMPITDGIPRPNNTTSDAGTYTCTYHGCTHRFESPAKLQRHKRDAHRQTTPGGHLVSRNTSLRNSQAGPHKCERINPSTGKACNSVFSRPYDLTRHEDTIHNARKQKVRCHLCTEEKTFSRNDALTRHMRVVHPEVDWPGKQHRRRD